MTIRIPFLDLKAATAELRGALDEAFARVLDSGWFIFGPELDAFEQEFARYSEAEHCIGLASGLDALTMGLLALDVGPGDEVIVPSHTYIATWLAVSRVGARLVAVEPEAEGFNIDPEAIAAAITPRTKAIIPVHLYGRPAELTPILELARDRGLRVLDDAAQAQGARLGGRRIGGLTDATAWSFYPGKNLGALGDGGAVTTNDPEIAARLRLLRNYGSKKKYVHEIPGFNSRLSELQAAALRVKLAVLDEWNDRRRDRAELYRRAITNPAVRLPEGPTPEVEPVWHLFVVRSERRDALQAALLDQGIHTLIHYPTPPHLQAAYKELGLGEGAFPRAERLHREVLSLPMGPHLSEDDAALVAEAVNQAAEP